MGISLAGQVSIAHESVKKHKLLGKEHAVQPKKADLFLFSSIGVFPSTDLNIAVLQTEHCPFTLDPPSTKQRALCPHLGAVYRLLYK